jgi:hypothetical protein
VLRNCDNDLGDTESGCGTEAASQSEAGPMAGAVWAHLNHSGSTGTASPASRADFSGSAGTATACGASRASPPGSAGVRPALR